MSNLAEDECVKVANGTVAKIACRATLRFTFAGQTFDETFMVLPQLDAIILGIPFFTTNKIVIDLANKRMQLPETDFTVQLNQIIRADGTKGKVYKKNVYPVMTNAKVTIEPNEQAFVMCYIDRKDGEEGLCGIVEPWVHFEKRTDICVTSSLSKENEKGLFPVGMINLTGQKRTISPKTMVGKLKLLTPQQVEFLTPIDPAILNMIFRHAKSVKEADDALAELYNLNVPANGIGRLNLLDETDGRDFWFPTPETCEHPELLKGVEKKIYDAIVNFQKLEKLNPLNSPEEREEFLAKFVWDNSVLTPAQRKMFEDLVVEYQHIFARHRMDIGKNTEFKVKLTPMDQRPVYTHGHPTPIHLREEMLIELSLMQYYGILTTLPYSKHASPIFAQRKTSGNLRILIDLRRINHLIKHDYDSHNFPISSLADVGNHLAGKKFFAKLDCSQAFHVVRMADLESIQLLAFNFESRTYAFQRLAQGLSRSVSSFSSFMRKYLDPCIAADYCFQYVDDVGSAAETPEELVDNLREVFKCIDKSGLRLTIKKCEFGLEKISFLGNSITSQGITPNAIKVEKFLETLKMPRNVKQVKRLIGFLQFFRLFLPNLSVKLCEFYKLLRNDVPFIINEEHKKNFNILKSDLKKATKTYLRLPKPDLQYVIVADASYYGAGYVLMIEDYCEATVTDKKILAPVSFGSKVFNESQLKMSTHAKEFLAVYYAFDTFAHILWGATDKKILVLTDNKSLARFFHSKTMPAPLWNFLDQLMSFRFILGHIPGRANAAADFLSRLQINPNDKMTLQMKASIPTYEIEMDVDAKTPDLMNALAPATREEILNSLDGTTQPSQPEADQGNLFVIEEYYSWDWQVPTVNVLNQANPLDTLDLAGCQNEADLKAEQKKDATIVEVRAWVAQGHYPRIQYPTYEEDKYLKQFERLTVRNGILYRKFFDDTGAVKVLQIVVPKHLRQELLYRLHNSKFKGHRGCTQTATEFREKFYYPGFTESLIKYVTNCQTCCQAKPIRNDFLKPPLQEVMTTVGAPGDMLQIDLVGKLNPSGGYNHILTAIDVFSRYLFAVPVKKVDAVTIARTLVGIFMRHTYLPVTILTDQGSVFVSELLKELTTILEVRLKHATVKHSQTLGTVERSHASLKKVLRRLLSCLKTSDVFACFDPVVNVIITK